MPIYMDVHTLPSVTANDVALAHQSDLIYQEEFGCNCLTYWFDQSRNSSFCLIEAPDRDAVTKLHSKSHGLVPNKIIEVSSTVVASFLGRIQDPDNAAISKDGLKVFSDPSFRILLIIQIKDPILLQHQLGNEKTNGLVNNYYAIVRKNIKAQDGNEAEHGGYGLIASFNLATKALTCALAIQKELHEQDANLLGFRMSIDGGEPVGRTNYLFGDTIQFAKYLCAITDYYRVAVSSTVKELTPYELYQNNHDHFLNLSPQEENFLILLFSMLEKYWKEPEYGTTDYCKVMAMSQSQFYRRVTALTGLSFNTLLQEYRLDKAREQMKKQRYSISQITFASGFSSPSYFTKCFKKKFGLLPKAYFDLLH
ncbi:MAG: DUF4242 domain-containing protein [Chitinophagaceae bacterium]|nr:DUF4242 domain-containing protein [Chitinophagaceae bacterium]MCW5929761.1 DUF4242 domain-containing protein [Chitinophagaceae bacterium]